MQAVADAEEGKITHPIHPSTHEKVGNALAERLDHAHSEGSSVN